MQRRRTGSQRNLEHERRSAEPSPFLRALRDEFVADATAQDGRVQIDVAPDLPAIRADGEALGRALWNRFESDLKVTIQTLGWRSGCRDLPPGDDIASVAFWYQAEPYAPFPKSFDAQIRRRICALRT